MYSVRLLRLTFRAHPMRKLLRLRIRPFGDHSLLFLERQAMPRLCLGQDWPDGLQSLHMQAGAAAWRTLVNLWAAEPKNMSKVRELCDFGCVRSDIASLPSGKRTAIGWPPTVVSAAEVKLIHMRGGQTAHRCFGCLGVQRLDLQKLFVQGLTTTERICGNRLIPHMLLKLGHLRLRHHNSRPLLQHGRAILFSLRSQIHCSRASHPN
mmetsp:Transcript_92535/g.299185  ORF Transcript_92535/g.299185 Transcript_92535/m.299185 type:complete len:208 (-) Transcript_92535:2133-2756(-)